MTDDFDWNKHREDAKVAYAATLKLLVAFPKFLELATAIVIACDDEAMRVWEAGENAKPEDFLRFDRPFFEPLLVKHGFECTDDKVIVLAQLILQEIMEHQGIFACFVWDLAHDLSHILGEAPHTTH